MRNGLKWIGAAALALGLAAGCSTLDEKQREWIFQPGDRTWAGGAATADGIEEVWIPVAPSGASAEGDAPRLHGLWLAQPAPAAPVALYLHGARWDVRSSAGRMRRLHELGFSVLGIDYRGFGKSSAALPSEESAVEDARAAWRWIAERQPQARRFVYGHSLGGGVAVQLAASVDDAAGLMLEGTFTSIADVFASTRWGWLPIGPLITQRFDSAATIGKVKVPVLVVHGSEDRVIPPALGRALYERASAPKRLVLVEGGTHHNASALGQAETRQAIEELFGRGS